MEPREPCQAGNRAALSGMFHVPRGRRFRVCKRRMLFILRGGVFRVSGAVPQVAAQGVLRRYRTGAHHRDTEKTGGRGPHLPRLPFHRHPGHRQDHLRQNSGQGRQLRTPGQRRPLLPVPQLRGAGKRQLSGRAGAGRRLQQRRGPGPCPAGRGHLRPRQREKAGLHRGRGPHAVHGGLQRFAENSGGAPGPPDVHSGHHGAPQGARHHPFPVPAVFLQAHPA